jgi:hypothetical protein
MDPPPHTKQIQIEKFNCLRTKVCERNYLALPEWYYMVLIKKIVFKRNGY